MNAKGKSTKKATPATPAAAPKKAPESKAASVSFTLDASQAQSVILTGEFTDWSTSGVAMKKGKDGKWKASVNLKPGRYEYKFIVDGNWQNDPQCPDSVANSVGSHNSVKVVSA